jgi:hypothetical protein
MSFGRIVFCHSNDRPGGNYFSWPKSTKYTSLDRFFGTVDHEQTYGVILVVLAALAARRISPASVFVGCCDSEAYFGFGSEAYFDPPAKLCHNQFKSWVVTPATLCL